VGSCGQVASVSGLRDVAGSREHDNEPLDFIKGGKFLYKLSDC
jgi:hypothetical protein